MIQKFRAWDTTNKEMFKDTFAITESGQVVIVDQSSVFVSPDYVFVENLVVMQSTGLFDKNGQEIFEGDIIDTTDYEGGLSSVGNPLVKVECDKYGFVVTGDFPASPITLKEFEDGRKFAGVKVTVIGNVYQNPELLEADHDRD